MKLFKKTLPHYCKGKQGKEPKDFFPILLLIIIFSGLLLILASYLAKTSN